MLSHTLTILLAAMLALPAIAADVTGTWTGQAIMKRDGETQTIPVTLTLRAAAGNQLAGTVQAGEDDLRAISAAKAESDTVYFELKDADDNGPTHFKVTMKLAGDRLTGTFTREQGGQTSSGEVQFTRKP
jgi:hypothetical protein